MNSSLKREGIIIALNEEIKKSIQEIFPMEGHKTVSFTNKQVIFKEGELYKGLYIIFSGLVKLSSMASGNKNFIFSIVGKGDYIGYAPLMINHSQYILSAIALTDVEASFVPDYVLKYLLEEKRVLKKYFLELMGVDAQNINQKVMDVAYKPVRGRLADALLLLDEKLNTRVGNGGINITRAELASYIGSVRETTIRLLSELKQEQIIDITNDSIKVTNHEKLSYISKLYK